MSRLWAAIRFLTVLPLPAGWVDYAAFASYAVGVVGLVGHFWTDRPAGSAWLAGLVGLALIHVAHDLAALVP